MGFGPAQGGDSGFGFLPAQGATTEEAASPSIVSVTPGGGSPGTGVTIVVSDFPSGWTLTDVLFDVTGTTDEVKQNETTITCSSPAGGGTVNVRVIANGGAVDVTATNAYTYA